MDDDDQLTNLDRCDRCGAQAWVVTHLAHGPIYWCNHHWRKHETAITAAGARVYDELDRLDAEHGPNRAVAEVHA